MSNTNHQVAHLWAHWDNDPKHKAARARSSNGNMSFEGASLYSYRTEIGRIVESVTGRRIALITSRTYSVTTSSKHMPPARRAASHLKMFCVENFSDHAGNLRRLVTDYREAIEKAKRSRDYPQEYRIGHVAAVADDYAETFGLKPPALPWEADTAAVAAYRAERDARNSTPEALAKREREKAQREARKAAKEAKAREAAEAAYAEALTGWLAGEGHYLPYRFGAVHLRVRGDTLETSQGARVPLADAIRAFRFAQLVRERGTAWERNGEQVRVGAFQIDRISANGDIRAGCHLIPWSESERIARQIGLFDRAVDGR